MCLAPTSLGVGVTMFTAYITQRYTLELGKNLMNTQFCESDF